MQYQCLQDTSHPQNHCVMGNGGDIETCDAPFSSQKSMIWSLNSLNKAKNKVIDKEGTCVDSSSPSRLSHPRLCTLCPSGNVATIFAQGYDNGWSEHLKSKRKGSARKWMWWVALLDSTLHKSRLFFFPWLVLRPSAFLFLFELILGNILNRTIYLLHANSFAAGIRRETSFPNKGLNDIKTGTVPGIAKAPNIEIMRQLATIEFVDAFGSRNTWLLASIGMHRYIWRWLDPTFALSSYVY